MRLIDVNKTFHMGEVDVQVLKDINLEINAGEITAIVGPSGSGKTTLINLIGGIDTPSSGEVWFEKQNLAALSERELTKYRRRNVGFVFQFYNLVPNLTALENVIVSAEISKDSLDPKQALEIVGLSHRLDHFPSQLSGGEQQRVSIARALAKRPKLLLCDEPTGALDLKTGKMVLGLLSRLNQEEGLTVIIITHNSPIAAIAHRFIRLGSGVIVESTQMEHPSPVEEITW